MKHQNFVGQTLKTFTFMSELGRGAWAVVYQAIDERDGSQVAIKVIPLELIKRTPKLQELIKTQVRVLKNCKNENVIRYVDNFMNSSCIFIVTQFCNGGDLQKYLQDKRRLTEDEATTFLKQILNGFRGLHEVNAMHRDFKVANVLLHNGACKIADLGFAKQMEKGVTRTILGTSLTMAPQVLAEQPYGMEADIWSIGVVYYQLLYGQYPYQGMSDPDILKKIRKGRPDYSGLNISAKSKDFIEKCLTVEPAKRISWRQIYEHPIIVKQQAQILYNLPSKININISENRDFYKKAHQVDIDVFDIKKERKIEGVDFQNAGDIRQSVNIEKLMEMKHTRAQKTNNQAKYQKLYLNRRNNIMFIFKFVSPYIYSLYSIKANHAITMFIMSKAAYIQMLEFYKNLTKKVNFMKLEPGFNQFSQSSAYQSLVSVIKGDIDMIEAQIFAYREDIQDCSKDVRAEYDPKVVANKKWNSFVDEMINSYWFLLAQNIHGLYGQQKQDLIKVMQAIDFYRSNQENADIQKFDKMIESIDYKHAEQEIQVKYQSLFE